MSPRMVQPDSGVSDRADEVELVEGLRRRSEGCFVRLVERYHASMLRLAWLYCGNRSGAEDVVQEAWLGVLRGIDRFESRSSLKTWIFQIVINCAKKHRRADGRVIPFDATGNPEEEDEPAMPARMFQGQEGRRPGHFLARLPDWDPSAESRLVSEEGERIIRAAIADLPPRQAEVITLRDLEGLSPREACELLGLSPENQRVLLHRARARIRQAVAGYFERTPE